MFSQTSSSISIVIPTYNRETILCNTIRHLLGLRGQWDEIIVVDQTPSHRQETELFLSDLRDAVRLIKVKTPNLPNARNIGAREAKGDVVLFLDDDITPLPSLITSHQRHYADPRAGGVAGKVISSTGQKGVLDSRYYTSPFPWLYLRFDQDWGVCEVESSPGGNMSFRRELILSLGGFDTRFAGNGFREETDFCLRLRNRSYKIIFDPDAAIVHHYAEKGGSENFRFGNPQFISFSYHEDFFHNNLYFFFKNLSPSHWPILTLGLYQAHVANKKQLHRGIAHITLRNLAFITGVLRAIRTSCGFHRTQAYKEQRAHSATIRRLEPHEEVGANGPLRK